MAAMIHTVSASPIHRCEWPEYE